MFNFFKKQADPIREYLNLFQNCFTEEQKAAIISALVIIGNSDRHVHPNEIQLVEEVANLLGMNKQHIYKDIARSGIDNIISILNTLDRNQKEWFVINMHNMVIADGIVEKSEILYLARFCEGIGISDEDYIQIANKVQL